jgi:hypothetical protein
MSDTTTVAVNVGFNTQPAGHEDDYDWLHQNCDCAFYALFLNDLHDGWGQGVVFERAFMVTVPVDSPEADIARNNSKIKRDEALEGKQLPTWRELFPEGRQIYYEGDEPDKFAHEILTEFGLYLKGELHTPRFGELIPADEHGPASVYYGFYCPPELLDAIYGSSRWPIGS